MTLPAQPAGLSGSNELAAHPVPAEVSGSNSDGRISQPSVATQDASHVHTLSNWVRDSHGKWVRGGNIRRVDTAKFTDVTAQPVEDSPPSQLE